LHITSKYHLSNVTTMKTLIHMVSLSLCAVSMIGSTLYCPNALAFSIRGVKVPSQRISVVTGYYQQTSSRVESFLQSSRDEDTEFLSPWSPGKWKITLQFKRDEDASNEITKLLGDDWGTNSAQLVLPLEIIVTADVSSGQRIDTKKANIQSSWLGGKPTGSIECISQTTCDQGEYHAAYINDKGQQLVNISCGQWRIEPPIPLTSKPLSGQASTLRFSLDIQTPIRRNTIYVPENTLLLLQCNTFREDQYAEGVKTLLPYQYVKDTTQQMLNEQLDHESGDRRLDGKDLLPLLEGYKDVAELVLKRDEGYKKWKEVESVLPRVEFMKEYDIDKILDDDERWGIWPGDTDLLTIERGVILAVTETKDAKTSAFSWLGNRDDGGFDSVVVGSWTALPIWDSDDQ